MLVFCFQPGKFGLRDFAFASLCEYNTTSDITKKLLEMCDANAFFENLAVLQIVDVPGNILKFVNISGRWFLIIRKSPKGSL